jgi:radical SAM superfamily enzyme YgiQ (UPF0313 family)
MRNILVLTLIAVSFFKVELIYSGKPAWPIYGMPAAVHYDPVRHEFVDKTPSWDMINVLKDLREGRKKHSLPVRIPEKKEIRVKFNLFWRREEASEEKFLLITAVASKPHRQKVLLVNGPSQDPGDRFFGWPTPLLYAIAPTVEAIRGGLLNLSLADKIFDPWCYVEGVHSQEIKSSFRDKLEREGADIVCVSATYDSLYPTLQLFAEAKKLNPRIVTILGGPHFDEVHNISALSDIFRHPELIDYAIAGDGEIALRELLKELSIKETANLQTVAENSTGRVWVYNNRGQSVSINKPLVLDELPFIPIELASDSHRLDFDVFTDEQGTILPTIQMIAARGCPYSCSFCSERKELAYPNVRSIGNIIQEIELRKQQGFRVVFFDDSTFGAYPKLLDLLHELKNTGMKFGSLNRFNHLTNPKLVEEFREAGFVYFYCAIELYDDEALRRMMKFQTTSHIIRGMRNLADFGFTLGVSLLYGLPYETEESIQATLDFTEEWVERGVIKLVSESVLSFHPGTPEGRDKNYSFDRTPPNLGYPWNRFEEGQWYHSAHVTPQYLEKILIASQERFSYALVRNRHSWVKKSSGVNG